MGHKSSPGPVCLSSCLYPSSGEGANGFCPLIFTVKVQGVKDAREMEISSERF